MYSKISTYNSNFHVCKRIEKLITQKLLLYMIWKKNKPKHFFYVTTTPIFSLAQKQIWPKLQYNNSLYSLFKLSICPSYFKYNPPDFLPQWKSSSSKKRLIFVHTFHRVPLRPTNLVRFRKFLYRFHEYTWTYFKIFLKQIVYGPNILWT